MKGSYRRKPLILYVCLSLAFVMLFPGTVQAATKTPGKPVISSAKVSGSSVQLTWKKAKNAKTYKVFVQTGADGWKYWKTVKANNKNKKKYSDTLKYKLKKSGKKYKVYKKKNPYKAVKTVKAQKYTYSGKYGATYRFVLQAVNGKKTGKYSAVKTVKIPAKPQNSEEQTPSEPGADDPAPGDPDPGDPPVTNCTVTFKNGVTGAVIDTRTVEKNSTVKFPEAPEVSHYIFTGWDKRESVIITDDTVITAQYRQKQKYTITYIDGTTDQAFKIIQVEEGDLAPEPTPPDYTNDPQNPWIFSGTWGPDIPISTTAIFTTPVKRDMTITAIYKKAYIIKWYDTYDDTCVSEIVAELGSGTPNYPSHTVGGSTFTANDIVGVNADESSKRNYRAVTDNKCDSEGARVISMYYIYPESHRITVKNSYDPSSQYIMKIFYVFDGRDGTVLLKSIDTPAIDGHAFTGYTYNGSPITSLPNVTEDMEIYANYE